MSQLLYETCTYRTQNTQHHHTRGHFNDRAQVVALPVISASTSRPVRAVLTRCEQSSCAVRHFSLSDSYMLVWFHFLSKHIFIVYKWYSALCWCSSPVPFFRTPVKNRGTNHLRQFQTHCACWAPPHQHTDFLVCFLDSDTDTIDSMNPNHGMFSIPACVTSNRASAAMSQQSCEKKLNDYFFFRTYHEDVNLNTNDSLAHVVFEWSTVMYIQYYSSVAT